MNKQEYVQTNQAECDHKFYCDWSLKFGQDVQLFCGKCGIDTYMEREGAEYLRVKYGWGIEHLSDSEFNRIEAEQVLGVVLEEMRV